MRQFMYSVVSITPDIEVLSPVLKLHVQLQLFCVTVLLPVFYSSCRVSVYDSCLHPLLFSQLFVICIVVQPPPPSPTTPSLSLSLSLHHTNSVLLLILSLLDYEARCAIKMLGMPLPFQARYRTVFRQRTRSSNELQNYDHFYLF